MHKNNQGLGSVAVLLPMVVSLMLLAGGWYVAHRQTDNQQTKTAESAPPSKAATIAAADKFLIDRVGQQNFGRFYKRVPGSDSFASPQDSTYDFLAYYFTPTDRYSEPSGEYTSHVQINRNKLSEAYTEGPDCRQDAAQRDFALTRDQALQISRNNGLGADTTFALVPYKPDGKKTSFVLLGMSCDGQKMIYLNYSNGAVLSTEPACDKPVEL